MEWFRTNQLDIMLVFIGVCGAITCSGLFTHASKIRRISLFLMGASATILLIADRFAYIHRGDVSETGYWMVRICELVSTRRNLDRAKQREIELLKQEKQTMRTLIEQTAYALAETIDMKDNYTHGHSTRVAAYAEMIAKELGWSGEQRKNLSYIALLHDVGKIGIPAEIINKDSRLTDEEYAVIKTHPVLGFQILSKINKFPDLSIGAHYHHERYDGKGYPDGLKGKDIPEIARIIAVADAYDAMTSKRSYRDALPQQIVRAEVEKGIGTQFDPDFARIMLKLIVQDTDYQMREI